MQYIFSSYFFQIQFESKIFADGVVPKRGSSSANHPIQLSSRPIHPPTAVMTCKGGNVINCFLPKVYVILERLENLERYAASTL